MIYHALNLVWKHHIVSLRSARQRSHVLDVTTYQAKHRRERDFQ